MALLASVCGPGGAVDEDVVIQPVVELASFAGGDWDGLTTLVGLDPVIVPCFKADGERQRAWRVLHYLNSNIYSVSSQIPRQTAAWSALRAATPLWGFRDPYMTIVTGSLVDEEPEETHRLLRLYVDGVPWNTEESYNGASEQLPRLLHCPAFTVWGTEEVKP